MKNKWLLFLIIGIVLIIIIALIIFLINKKEDPDEPPIKGKEIKDIKNLHYSYSVGYAMYAYYTYDIECEDKCTIKIKPNGYPDEEAKTYDVSDDKMNDIISVLNKYEVSKWDGYNKSDKNVLDGNSFSFSLTTKDGANISAHGYMMWPKHYREVREELTSIFDSFIKEGDFKKQ